MQMKKKTRFKIYNVVFNINIPSVMITTIKLTYPFLYHIVTMLYVWWEYFSCQVVEEEEPLNTLVGM